MTFLSKTTVGVTYNAQTCAYKLSLKALKASLGDLYSADMKCNLLFLHFW